MKKLAFFTILLVLLTCCKKDPQVTPEYTITLSQLSGNWETVQFSYNGDTLLNDSLHATGCMDANNDSITHGKGLIFIKLNRLDTATHTCTIQDCNRSDAYSFQLLPDKINLTLTQTSGVDLTFDIISYDGNTLVLKLVYASFPNRLIGCTYILKRPEIRPTITPYAGRWVNDYVLVDYRKDTVAERYQFEFIDGGQAIMTSANDSSVHKIYNSWIIFHDISEDNLELIDGNDVMLYNIVLPTVNTMILSVYNYKYYLTKVK
jgi:hypothetical protein